MLAVSGKPRSGERRLSSELDPLTTRLDLKIVHVYSHPLSESSGETGHLRAEIIDRHLPERRTRLQYFICGSPPMMRAAEDALAELHIPHEQIHVERFAMV